MEVKFAQWQTRLSSFALPNLQSLQIQFWHIDHVGF